uniref:Hydantoinase A/oxoprolinase domain-containing protein n=1 Tax=Streptomyces sp. NBC_00049 TaxID=2903617 RepID=A0AAU2K123_9ACTN
MSARAAVVSDTGGVLLDSAASWTSGLLGIGRREPGAGSREPVAVYPRPAPPRTAAGLALESQDDTVNRYQASKAADSVMLGYPFGPAAHPTPPGCHGRNPRRPAARSPSAAVSTEAPASTSFPAADA